MILSIENNIALLEIEQTDDNINILIEDKISEYKSNHFIVDVSNTTKCSYEVLQTLKQKIASHKSEKKSFIFISSSINSDDTDETLMIVPTLQEAYDIIEMEEIERDLGF